MTKNLWLRTYTIEQWHQPTHGHDFDNLVRLRNICKIYLIHRISFIKKLKKTSDDFELWKEMSNWCDINFNDRFCLWDSTVNCRNEVDAMAFKLRWS